MIEVKQAHSFLPTRAGLENKLEKYTDPNDLLNAKSTGDILSSWPKTSLYSFSVQLHGVALF